MPRVYQRKRKKVYDEKVSMKAINAVKNGESVREAERNYAVPKSTIADSMKKKYK